VISILILLACGHPDFDRDRAAEALERAGYDIEADGPECVRVNGVNRVCSRLYRDVETATHAGEVYPGAGFVQFVRGRAQVRMIGPDREQIFEVLREAD